MREDEYTDRTTDDVYDDDVPGDDPYEDEAYDNSVFPYGGAYYPFGWSIWPGTTPDDDDDEVYGDETYDDEAMTAETYDDDSWWDEGLISLLLVAGLVLFLFPEPATSGIGIALIAVGAFFWLIDWLA